MSIFDASLTGIAMAVLVTLAACAGTSPPAPPASLAAAPAPKAMPGTMRATLSGSSHVPPVDGAGAGALEAVLDPDSGQLRWNMAWLGMSGAVTAMHFHGPAMPGDNAAIAIPVGDPLASPLKGSVDLTPVQQAQVRAGHWYVDLHTAAHPGGEIRGQLIAMP